MNIEDQPTARYGRPWSMGLHTFERGERIRCRADFLKASKKGNRVQTDHFIVAICPNGLSQRRLGITVSKRVGPAIKRNRLKRLIREFFRLNKETLPSSSDLVITAKEGAAGLNFWHVSEELNGIFSEQKLRQ